MMSKVFENTAATDGQWTGNTLTDTIAGQQLGILVPNSPLAWGQLQYEAGACAYRIQDAQSLPSVCLWASVRRARSPHISRSRLSKPSESVLTTS